MPRETFRQEDLGRIEEKFNEGNVLNVASRFATEFDMPPSLSAIRTGPPTWIYINNDPSGQKDPTDALRLVSNDKQPDLIKKTRKNNALLRELYERGAQIQEVRGEPQERDGFVASLSGYLPGEVDSHNLASYKDYGKAVSTLHKAGVELGEDEAIREEEKAKSFKPLTRTQETYRYLETLYQNGGELKLGDTIFSVSLLEIFKEHLTTAEEAASEMVRLSAERGYPLTTIIHDAHIGNVRRDKEGQLRLIDLDDLTWGPAEYDLGRPKSQWTQHFKRDLTYAEHFVAGYTQERGGRDLDDDILNLGMLVSRTRYGTSTLTHAVDAAKQGRSTPIDEWLLQEGIRRLTNLHDPQAKWWSREEYLKATPQ